MDKQVTLIDIACWIATGLLLWAGIIWLVWSTYSGLKSLW
jgi:hypothetical protein